MALHAVQNATRIAHETAKSMSLGLGKKPLKIIQENLKESHEYLVNNKAIKSWNEILSENTLKLKMSVKITFELKPNK